MFRLFADNNQCKHIFFAGCHDAGYLSLLTPYRGKADRITLIKGASFHREYESLNLPVWEMPLIFMPTSLGAPNPPTTSRPVCKHFQKVNLANIDATIRGLSNLYRVSANMAANAPRYT